MCFFSLYGSWLFTWPRRRYFLRWGYLNKTRNGLLKYLEGASEMVCVLLSPSQNKTKECLKNSSNDKIPFLNWWWHLKFGPEMKRNRVSGLKTRKQRMKENGKHLKLSNDIIIPSSRSSNTLAFVLIFLVHFIWMVQKNDGNLNGYFASCALRFVRHGRCVCMKRVLGKLLDQ